MSGGRDERLYDALRRQAVPDRLLYAVYGPTDPPPPTVRELDVARCLAHGMNEQMAADALGISRNTVKTHLRNLRYRLAAKNTLHAVVKLVRQGLI